MSEPIVLAQLEYAVYRILYAHQFSKSSRRPMNVLVDLLARYLGLLASTCASYAQHAGRESGNMFDAVLALQGLGSDISELIDWNNREGRVNSQHPSAIFHSEELRAILDEGRRSDRTDNMVMTYQRLPSPVSDEEPMLLDCVMDVSFDYHDTSSHSLPNGLPHSPTLPLSPISNPSPMSSPLPTHRRRQRQRNWAFPPPDYIPSFLPPFPGQDNIQSGDKDDLSVANGVHEDPMDIFMDQTYQGSKPLPDNSKETVTIKQQPTMPLFKDSIPYDVSSLSSAPKEHLPPAPHREPNHKQASLASHPYLLVAMQAASEIVGTTNPARLAITSMLSSSAAPRYGAVDTLYSSSNPNSPRHLPPAPSYAVPLNPEAHPNATLPISFNPRSIKSSSPLNPTPAYTHPRIQTLAEQISKPGVYERSTHIIPPPAFSDLAGGVSIPRLHGRPQRAPWNSLLPTNNPNQEKTKAVNHPDALLYSTWDYPLKSFEEPLWKKTGAGMPPKQVDDSGNAGDDVIVTEEPSTSSPHNGKENTAYIVENLSHGSPNEMWAQPSALPAQ